jgi:hypothetical protein
VTPVPLRVTWQTRPLYATLTAGQTTQLNAVLSVTQAVDLPSFRVDTQNNAVTVDLASLPARLEVGQSYTIRLNATMPGTVKTVALVYLLSPDGGTTVDYETIWLLPP